MMILTGVIALCVGPRALLADSFTQTNLVSNVPGLAAVTDPNLVNPRGRVFSAISPFWVSDQNLNKAILYSATGAVQFLVVSIRG